MRRETRELLEHAGVRVRYLDLHKEGLYIDALRVIVVSSRLDDKDQERVILHELGHAVEHQGCSALYTATQTQHIKMEGEANDYMLREKLAEYVSDRDISKENVDAVTFLESQKISLNFLSSVEELIKTGV